MDTRIDEIAEGIYRISTHTDHGPPGGFVFNQFLIDADEPVLVHTGMQMHFGPTLEASSKVLDPSRLRWITSNHASRPDELGALDEWFAVAPHAQVAHGEIACRVNLGDLSRRTVRAIPDGGVLDVGSHRLRWRATPHVPGPWEAGILVEETTGVMFCGDLFAQAGRTSVTTTADIVGAAIAHDRFGHGTALTPTTAPTLRRLAECRPTALGLMHGPAYVGDASTALTDLAAWFDRCLHDEVVGQWDPGLAGVPQSLQLTTM